MAIQVADPYAQQRQSAKQAGYSDQEVNDYISKKYAPIPTPKKETKGRGGFLTSIISETAGTLGGVGGFLLGGPLGAAAGAGLGSSLGSALEQKVRDDKVDVGKAAKEGVFSAATSAVPFGKVLKGGAKIVKGGAKALTSDVVKGSAAKVAKDGTEEVAGNGFLNKLTNRAKYADQKASGLKAGQPLGGGEVLSPEYADELHNFLRTGSEKYLKGGVKPGAPINQATAANKVMTGVNSSLDESLKGINRKLTDSEADSLIQNVDFKILNDENVTGATALSNKFKNLVKGKDIASLEKLRRSYDKTAFTANGAGKTAKAAEARVLRDAIDEFVTPLSPEYKAVKGDWKLANDALRLTSKGSANAKGAKIPLINVEVGEQSIPGAVSKTGNFLSRMTGGGVPTGQPIAPEVASRSTGNILSRVLAGRVVDNATNTPEAPQEITQESATPDLGGSTMEAMRGGGTDPFSPDNAQAFVREILANGGTMKDVSEYLSNIKTMQELGGTSGGKALNSTASGVIADTKTGLTQLQKLSNDIAESSANNPGIGWLRGKNPLDTNAQNLQASIATAKQIVGKALEGGVLRAEDEKKYAKILPTLNDTDAVAQHKIQELVGLISGRLGEYQANITGGSGGTDLAELGL